MSEFNVRPLVKHVSLAFAASALALGFAGCGKSEGTASNGNTTQISSPKGTVIGSVVDNQGNPLAGVKVTIGSQTQTTTSAGTYQFNNVAVNTTTASSSTNGQPTGQFFTVVLQPPSGYLGATITAYASSQCVAGCTQSGGAQTGNSGSVTNPQTIFVDGYTASAGTTALPALNATVTGTLRNGATGAADAGVPLYAQLVSVNLGSAQSSTSTTGNSTVVTYATGSATPISGGQTGADGSFSLSGLAADACYSIYSNNFNVSYNATSEVQTSDVSGGCGEKEGASAAIANILVSTNNSPIGLNQIYALASPNADVTRPWVTSTDHVISSQPTVTPGQLDSTVTNTLVIHFSEKMVYTPSTTNPLTVIIGSGANLTTATVTSATFDSTGTALTLVLANNLPTGAQVLVNLPIESFTDTSGNLLNDHTGATLPDVAYDGLTSSNNTIIDQLKYNTFQPGNTQTGTFSVSQVFAAKNTTAAPYSFSNVLGDVVGSSTSSKAAQVTSSFDSTGATTTNLVDLQTGAGLLTVNQLNAVESSAATYGNGNIVQDELSSLLNVISGANPVFPTFAAFPPGAESVNTSVARVTITLATPAQVADLALQVTDSLGNAKSALFFPVNSAGGPNAPVAEGPIGLSISPTVTPTKAAANNSTSETPNIASPAEGWYGVNPKGNASFDVIIVGQGSDVVKPGDLLHVVSRANLSGAYLVSQGQVLTLKDGVDPTVTLQILAGTSNASGSGPTGQGGVIYQGAVAGNAGMVIFPVTPQLADTSDATEATPIAYATNSFLQELYNPSGLKAAGAADASGTDGSGNKRADTDATGVNAFLTATTGGANNVPTGIAVSENVTVPAALAVPYAGASTTPATLSGFGSAANVQSKKYPVGYRYNDLVTFTISNIFNLAADGRSNSVIDLTGSITDQASNTAVAGDNAKVLVQDYFPPFVVAGYTDGKNYVLTFNEPIQLYGQLTFESSNAPVTVDLHTLATATPTALASLDSTKKVLTIAQTAVSGNVFYPATDTTHTYAESYYTTANTGVATIPAKLQHGYVSFTDVPDSVGNTWDTVSGTPAPNSNATPWAKRHLGMGSPRFAIVNLVGPLGVTAGFSGFTTGSTSFTATIAANQPLINWLYPSQPAGGAGFVVGTPAEPAIYGAAQGVTTAGTNPCASTNYGNAACKTFIDDTLTNTGLTLANSSTAALSADGTTLTYTITLTNPIASGNSATLVSTTNTFESSVIDPNTGNNGVFSLNTAANLSTITAP